MIASTSPISQIAPYLGVVAFLAAGWVVFRGAAAKESAKWQATRLTEMKDDLLAATNRIAKLESENEVLTEKVTQAAAVKKLTEYLQQMHDENREEHAELAAIIGSRLRIHERN